MDLRLEHDLNLQIHIQSHPQPTTMCSSRATHAASIHPGQLRATRPGYFWHLVVVVGLDDLGVADERLLASNQLPLALLAVPSPAALAGLVVGALQERILLGGGRVALVG